MFVEFLLVFLMVFVLVGTITRGVVGTFEGSAPHLGARIEKHLETGAGFSDQGKARIGWEVPPGSQKDVE